MNHGGTEARRRSNIALNVVLAALFVGTLVFLTARYAPELTRFVAEPAEFRDYVLSFGRWSAIVFMLFQVLQVVIAAIPGEPVQIAGGYLFGTFLGTVYSLIGITAGYILVFSAVRFLGYPLVRKLVPEESLNRFGAVMNSPKLEVTIFLLFLIPGIPKDFLVYIAGLTPIRPSLFFVIVTIARLPAMIGSSYIGAKIQTGEYYSAIAVSVVAGVLFILGLIFKDRIIAFLHRRWRKDGHTGQETVGKE